MLGQKTVLNQALMWPRYSVRDPDYSTDGTIFLLAYTAIPKRIQNACAELTMLLLTSGTTDPLAALPDGTKYTKAKVDVIEVEFLQGIATATDAVGVLRRYPTVWSLLAPLTNAGQGFRVVRA
jgi:hypothetical protein